MRSVKGIALLAALGVLACGRSEVKPVDLYPEDLCAHCKMAISVKAFAGEVVKEDGEVLKFDDLGCLRAAMGQAQVARGAHLFVRVMEKEGWVKAAEATIVKAVIIQTPMGSGLIAFAERREAENFVKQHGGEILSLDEFLKGRGFHEQ
jgi:copper chaperone NosL